MTESPVFEWASAVLEERTGLDRLTARGTLRLALRKSGLKSQAVTKAEMGVVFKRVMPAELQHRGIVDANGLCTELAASLEEQELEPVRSPRQRPEDVFRRFFGEPK